MKSFPKISIVIPCFNNDNTIIETIESVMKQVYSSIEMIIVNDGSTDNSEKVITSYIESKKITNITLINQANAGPSKSRNNGAHIATGTYLMFLDADDLLAPTYIDSCIAKLERDKNLNIVYTEGEYFGAKKGKWNLPNFSIPNFLEANCIPISAVIRNEVFKKVGGFDENLGYTEDWDLWIRIVQEVGGVYKIDQPLFFYRKRFDKSSITDNSKNLGQQSTIYIYNKNYSFFAANGYDIETLLQSKDSNGKYKKKYYNVWYRKLFYKLRNKSNK
nr:glycosyltransferase family A protein [Flavobacterium sp.]